MRSEFVCGAVVVFFFGVLACFFVKSLLSLRLYCIIVSPPPSYPSFELKITSTLSSQGEAKYASGEDNRR